jgi:hypothetical protein
MSLETAPRPWKVQTPADQGGPADGRTVPLKEFVAQVLRLLRSGERIVGRH